MKFNSFKDKLNSKFSTPTSKKIRWILPLSLAFVPLVFVSCSISPSAQRVGKVVGNEILNQIKNQVNNNHQNSKNQQNHQKLTNKNNNSNNSNNSNTQNTTNQQNFLSPLPKRADVIPQKGETIYVRPPFITNFTLKNTDLKISTIFNHLDSPGFAERNKKVIESKVDSSLISTKNVSFTSQGSQEVSEYLGLGDVINYASHSQFNPNLIVYGGDTNIKNQNFFLTQEIFKNDPQIHSTLAITPQIESKFKSNEQFLTSLGTNGNYSNQYDKMLYLSNGNNLKVQQIDDYNHQYKIDLYKIFQPWLLGDTQINTFFKKSKEKEATFIRKKLSDHAPVYTDVVVTNTSKLAFNTVTTNTTPSYSKVSSNILRIGHWNILNYGKALTNSPTEDFQMKAKMIATVIKNGGFDIIGLTEINNGQGESVKLILDNLKKLNPNANYQVIVQKVVDTNIPKSLLASNRFGVAQQEQVAVIYDANVVNVDGSYSYTKAIKFYGK